jgi:hypothetical protein
MNRTSTLLALALSCLLPATALAKDPAPPRRDKEPQPMSAQETEALNKCMFKCQEPMAPCLEGCKDEHECGLRCANKFTKCINKTCGNLFPKQQE